VQIQGHTLEEQDELSEDFQEMVVAALYRVVNKLSLKIAREVSGRTGLVAAGPLDDVSDMWDDEVPELVSYLNGVYDAGALEVASELAVNLPVPDGQGIPGVPDSFSLEYLQQATNRLSGVGDELWENIRDEITVGLANGESTNEIATRIQNAAGFTEARAKTVARTELVAASNAGTHQQVLMIVPDAQKEWVSTTDGRTRMTHRHADGQRVPVDQAFVVGGSTLRWPGDPGGAAGEVVNCRCTLIFDVEEASVPELTCGCTDDTSAITAALVNMPGSSCTCAVTLPTGPTGMPTGLTPLQHDEIYSAFMNPDPISPAYGGAKIYKKLLAAKAKFNADHPDLVPLSEHQILAVVDEIYKGKKFTFTEKFDEWLKSAAGKKAAPGVSPGGHTPSPSLLTPSHTPSPSVSVPHTPAAGSDLTNSNLLEILGNDDFTDGDVVAYGESPFGVPHRLVKKKSVSGAPYFKMEYQDSNGDWGDTYDAVKSTNLDNYTEYKWKKPADSTTSAPTPTPSATTPTMDHTDLFLEAVDVNVKDGDIIAQGVSSSGEEFRVLKKVKADGTVLLRIERKDSSGKWQLEENVKHKNHMDSTYSDVTWSKPGTSTHVPTPTPPTPPTPPSPVVTVHSPVDVLSVSDAKKKLLLSYMKDPKPITPGWGGAKVYKQLEIIKTKIAGDPAFSGLTDKQLLQLMDSVADHKTGKTYESVAVDWLNTAPGKKYAGGDASILDGPSPATVTPTPTKAAKKAAKKATPSGSASSTKPTAYDFFTQTGDITSFNDTQMAKAFTSFKTSTPGSYLSDPPEKIWNHLVVTLEKLHADPQFSSLTHTQLLRLIDERAAKMMGVSNKHLFEKKITEWGKTPAGKKHINGVADGSINPTPAPAKKATPSYGTPSPAKTTPTKQTPSGATTTDLPKPDTPKLNANSQAAKPTSNRPYDSVFHGEIVQIRDEMMAQQGEWTAAQKSSLKTYTGSSYSAINGCLRGTGPCSPQTLKHIANAQAGMRRSTRNILLRRGTNADEFPGFTRYATFDDLKTLEGRRLRSDSFLSTSYGDSAAFGGNVLIEFEVPAGTPVAYLKDISHFPSENELLLGAGLEYNVTSVTKVGHRTVVRVRVIVP
jgi:hypothetical protein